MVEVKEKKKLRVFYNFGPSAFTLKAGPEGTPRVIRAGESVEALDEAEEKYIEGFFQFKDVAKFNVGGINAEDAAPLKAQIKKLEEENKALQELLDEKPIEKKKKG